MALLHTDEQAMLADAAHAFVAETAPIRHLRTLRDSDDPTGFDAALWKQFASMGYNGILIEEKHGGLGLGHVEAGIVLEKIGRNLTPSPFLSTAVGAATALAHGAEAQRERWLPGIAAGEVVAALALDEGSKHRPTRIRMRAERSGNGFVLNGAKQFVVHGHVADLVIVSARTAGQEEDEEGITLFVIDRNTPGVATQAERLADSSIAARMTFDAVRVDADAVIGEVDRGSAGLARLLRALRAGGAAELAGVGGGVMDMTIDYLGERRQFGKAIGSFQTLQHRAAILYTEMELARAAVLKAGQLLDAEDPGAEKAAMVAKAMAGSAAALAVQEGVQMHGGVGMTDEYDVGLYMKRQRVLAEMFGDSDFHADRLARLSGY